jgi:hypothetical protein
MNNILQQSPFGFSKITIGSLTVYTAKIRLRDVRYEPDVPYLNVYYKGQYCFISFEVIDINLAEKLWNIIGTLCYNVAKARLENKYGWVNNKLK